MELPKCKTWVSKGKNQAHYSELERSEVPYFYLLLGNFCISIQHGISERFDIQSGFPVHSTEVPTVIFCHITPSTCRIQ